MKTAKNLKDNLIVLSKAAVDKRSPLGFKIILIIIVAYILSPIDIIPDFIPVLGLLDEAILIPILLKLAYGMIPETLMAEYKQGQALYNTNEKKLKYLGLFLVLIVWGLFLLIIYWVYSR